MICFQISIFEPLETTIAAEPWTNGLLWFAFKLVSLNHWKQQTLYVCSVGMVVICFQISIFEPLETTQRWRYSVARRLWFAFKLVSLNHWKQRIRLSRPYCSVVICFQISIFEPLETTSYSLWRTLQWLWFAFKLVSLNHWKQRRSERYSRTDSCDLLSN